MSNKDLQTELGAHDGHNLSAVVVSAHRRVAGGTEMDERLATFRFDPLRNYSVREALHPSGLPRLFLSLSYSADGKALTLLVLQDEHNVLHVNTHVLTDTHITSRIADGASISILVHSKAS
jgi:hypothetical protein